MSAHHKDATSPSPRMNPPSAWAQGFIMFASVVMVMAAFFQLVVGLAALFEDEIYVAAPEYFVELDTTIWGWIHLLFGVLLLFAAYAIMNGQVWGRSIGVAIALMSAVANFAFLPYYPFWSMAVIALNILVIWALTAHGRDLADGS